jgi:hypothetical protein
MHVNSLDHVDIRTEDLQASARSYVDSSALPTQRSATQAHGL